MGKAFANALSSNTTLTSLIIRGGCGEGGIGSKGAHRLAAALKLNTSILYLCLDGNSLGDEGAKYIGQALEDNGNIRGISLRHNNICSNGAKILGSSLAGVDTLSFLDLSGNRIADGGAIGLCDTIMGEHREARCKVDVSHNQIHEEGGNRLYESLESNSKICIEWEGNCFSDKLEEKIWYIHQRVDASLSKYVVEATLKSLGVANKDEEIGIMQNDRAMMDSDDDLLGMDRNWPDACAETDASDTSSDGPPTKRARTEADLEKSNDSGSTEGEGNELESKRESTDNNQTAMSSPESESNGLELDLLRSDWDDGYLQKRRICALSVNDSIRTNLIKLLDESRVIETLYLMCDEHTLDNTLFTFVLSTNRTLRSLVVFQGRGQVGIGAEGARMLSAAVKDMKRLEYLCLDDQGIGDEGAKHIADALKDNTNIKILSLRNNSIGGDGAKELGIVHRMSSMMHLDLSENYIGDEGVRELCTDALGSLRRCDLDANEIGDVGGNRLASALGLHKNLHIELHDNDWSKEVEERISNEANESRRKSKQVVAECERSLGMLDVEGDVGTCQTVHAMSDRYSWAFVPETGTVKSSDSSVQNIHRPKRVESNGSENSETKSGDKESSAESEGSDLESKRQSAESNTSEESGANDTMEGCKQKLVFTYDWQEKFEELAQLARDDGPVSEEAIAKIRNRV